MDYINVDIGYDLIRKFIESFGEFHEVKIERKDQVLNVILTSKVMGFVKIPISIKFKLKHTQSSPEDPVIFSIDTMSMIKKIIKDHSGGMFEYDGDELKIYPYKITAFLKKFVMFDIEFKDEMVSIKLKPYTAGSLE